MPVVAAVHDSRVPRLPDLLTSADLPAAELNAVRLDGELYPLSGCFSPVDLPETPTRRAAAVRALTHPRLIAERSTAAWVYGARQDPPWPAQLCTESRARAHNSVMISYAARQVVLQPSEIVVIGGLRLTSMLRTALDIARQNVSHGAEEERVLAELARRGGFTLDDCMAALRHGRNRSHRKTVAARLEAALGRQERAIQPAETR